MLSGRSLPELLYLVVSQMLLLDSGCLSQSRRGGNALTKENAHRNEIQILSTSRLSCLGSIKLSPSGG
jgi:hypothetical protein